MRTCTSSVTDEVPLRDGDFDEFRFGRVHVNPAECVVFYADVRNATVLGAGVFRHSPGGPVTTLARVGQPMLGSTIQVIEILDEDQARLAGVSAINAVCDVTFRVRLADGREAVIATVPEPSACLLASFALVTLATLRRTRRPRGAS